MKDDYLWDGSGEPDPEIQHLESVLLRFRQNRPAPDFSAPVSAWQRWRAAIWLPRLVTATVALLLVIGIWRAARVPKPSEQILPGWQVARLAGAPTIGSERIGEKASLAVGQWLETDAFSRALVNVGRIGEVRVDPDTRLRLVETRSSHRLALARGTIYAMIWAPPGEFVVDTPSSTAVDLGCAYTLHIDDKGAGLLRVTFGWVGFRLGNREAFIPEGAVCVTRPGVGPGTPYFEDASRSFRQALEDWDFGKGDPRARNRRLTLVLAQARKRDALTLWHLLARVDDAERDRVYDRLAQLVSPPAGVTREGILRGDESMRDSWWNALGLGDTSWWRIWERDWSPPNSHDK